MKYINPVNYRQNIFTGSSLRDIERELNILFNNGRSQSSPSTAAPKNTRPIKNMNWYENESAYVVRFDLPGVKSADVSLEIETGVLALRAKRSNSETKADTTTLEYSYVANLKVPENVEEGGISADLKNGVISISFPKEERAKARRIEVREAN